MLRAPITGFRLQPLNDTNESPLFQRRQLQTKSTEKLEELENGNDESTAMSFGGALCTRCGQGFAPKEEMVNSNGEIWHTKCFVESGHAANPALGAGAAAEQNLVMGIEGLDVEESQETVGLQENKFPVDDDDAVSETGTALESIQGDFEPEGELQWQDSGLQSQPLEAKIAEEKRGEDVDVVLGLKESPEAKFEEQEESRLKRQSSLQEARKRFQDSEEYGQQRDQRGTPYDAAVPDDSYKSETTEVDTRVIRKPKSAEKRNGILKPARELSDQVAQDSEPIYQPYKKPDPPVRDTPNGVKPIHDPVYQASFKQTERQDFETEMEENLSKFPTNIEYADYSITNGRPATEYINGPPVPPPRSKINQQVYDDRPPTEYMNPPVPPPPIGDDYDGGSPTEYMNNAPAPPLPSVESQGYGSGSPTEYMNNAPAPPLPSVESQGYGNGSPTEYMNNAPAPPLPSVESQGYGNGSPTEYMNNAPAPPLPSVQSQGYVNGSPTEYMNNPPIPPLPSTEDYDYDGRPPTEYVNNPPVPPRLIEDKDYKGGSPTEYMNNSFVPPLPVAGNQGHDGRIGDQQANDGRPPTEYINGPPTAPPPAYATLEQDYDGRTLRAQSGGRQQSVMDSYKDPTERRVKNFPLPERPVPQFGSKMVCAKCESVLDLDGPIVNYNGNVWHPQCFVCVQCFQPFPEGIFYEFEGRKYCEHDFHMLFAPCCGACGEFVVGRVIKAMNSNWHPHCFLCEICNVPLADAGFYKNAGRALCKECNNREKAAGMGKYVCHKCHSIIEEGHIKFKGEAYHPYHFNCTNCEVELNADGREKNGELFCLRCHDKMGIPICGACRRPIEERVVHALGKTWHVEHFVCAKCEKPFLGARHYEKRGLAYCEIHYHQLFGNMCFLCNNVIAGDVFSALNKAWCTNHFACYLCDKKLNQKNKFFEFDLKPVCKMCYEHFPSELKKRMKKAYEQSPKK